MASVMTKLLDDESDRPWACVVEDVFVRSAHVMVTPSEEISRHLSEEALSTTRDSKILQLSVGSSLQ